METLVLLGKIIDTPFNAEGYETLLKYEMTLRDMWVHRKEDDEKTELVLNHCLKKQQLILSLLF